jgi:6-phosphogluconolactonase
MAVMPRILEFEDPTTLAAALATEVATQLRQALEARGTASLVVPGGRTPAIFLEALSEAALPWPSIFVTLNDERWVDPGDAASNERLLRSHLLRNAATGARIVALFNDDPVAEAGALHAWQALKVIPRPFDVVVLGMGEDGHFASLFPNDPVSATGLDPDAEPGCLAVLAPALPAQRITLNLAALLQSRQLMLLATGMRKQQVLDEQLEGLVTPLPVRELLVQEKAPLSIWWSP